MSIPKEVAWSVGHIVTRDVYAMRQFAHEPIATVLDIGANLGVSALAFRILFNRARIIAVEPGQEAFAVMSGYRRWGIEPHQLALGDGSDLCMHGDTGRTGLNRMVHKDEPWWDGKAVKVPSMTLPKMFDRFIITAPYILKIDCEGGERFLLRDPGVVPLIRGCRHLAIEIHQGFGGSLTEWNPWLAQFLDTHILRERVPSDSKTETPFREVRELSRVGKYEVCLTSRGG